MGRKRIYDTHTFSHSFSSFLSPLILPFSLSLSFFHSLYLSLSLSFFHSLFLPLFWFIPWPVIYVNTKKWERRKCLMKDENQRERERERRKRRNRERKRKRRRRRTWFQKLVKVDSILFNSLNHQLDKKLSSLSFLLSSLFLLLSFSLSLSSAYFSKNFEGRKQKKEEE